MFKSSKRGRPQDLLRDPVAGCPWDQMIGRFRDVRRRSSMFFKFNSQTHETYFDR